MSNILLVDDDEQLRDSFDNLLQMEGYSVQTASSGEEAIGCLDHSLPDVVIMDVRMSGLDGISTLKVMHEKEPRLPVIIMTAYSTTEAAIEATKNGAYDYILKPFNIPEILEIIKNAVNSSHVMRSKVWVNDVPQEFEKSDVIIGTSKPMQDVYKSIGRVAPTDAVVLLRGESGTGKELVARALYQHSLRSEMPFSIINCVAIPDTLLESELFGYEKGAFTGADAKKIGKIEQAGGGTIFLDEIGDMPFNIQGKLLRLLQEKQIERLGGRAPIAVDVRIIAATNRNLEEAVSQGRFREDLYYRLNVITLHLPPLRERLQDVAMLVNFFVNKIALDMGKSVPEVTAAAIDVLMAYSWPGNVRELHNLVQNILVFNRGEAISGEAVTTALKQYSGKNLENDDIALEDILDSLVKDILIKKQGSDCYEYIVDCIGKVAVEQALQLCNGNRSQSAKMLGLSRPTLLAKMEKYNLH